MDTFFENLLQRLLLPTSAKCILGSTSRHWCYNNYSYGLFMNCGYDLHLKEYYIHHFNKTFNIDTGIMLH